MQTDIGVAERRELIADSVRLDNAPNNVNLARNLGEVSTDTMLVIDRVVVAVDPERALDPGVEQAAQASPLTELDEPGEHELQLLALLDTADNQNVNDGPGRPQLPPVVRTAKTTSTKLPKGSRSSRGANRYAGAATRKSPKSRQLGVGDDPVLIYLSQIGQYPLLTKGQEVDLAQAIRAGVDAKAKLEAADGSLSPEGVRKLRRIIRGGEEAELLFVHSNLRLVVSIAKKYQSSNLPLLDLVQEGNLGLMHAVTKFDWRKGFKFSTYATWWIRQAITRGIANTGRTVRLPVHAGDALNRLHKARSAFEQEAGRTPTLEELVELIDMPREKVIELLYHAVDTLSLNEQLSERGFTELGDMIEDKGAQSPEEAALIADLPNDIAKLLQPLNERERRVLILRYGLDTGEPRTLEEVGEYFTLTRERIRQIEARAMSKLRHPGSGGAARDLLGV